MIGILDGKWVCFDYVNLFWKMKKLYEVEFYGIMFDWDFWYLVGCCVDIDMFKVYCVDCV